MSSPGRAAGHASAAPHSAEMQAQRQHKQIGVDTVLGCYSCKSMQGSGVYTAHIQVLGQAGGSQAVTHDQNSFGHSIHMPSISCLSVGKHIFPDILEQKHLMSPTACSASSCPSCCFISWLIRRPNSSTRSGRWAANRSRALSGTTCKHRLR